MTVNSNGYIQLGGNIRNIYILLLLTFGLGQDQLHHFVEIDQPQLRERGPCISEEQRQKLQSDIKNNRELLIQQGKLNRINDSQERVLFDFPLKAADVYEGFNTYIIWNFVDHDPNYPNQLLDYNCGQRTYDTENARDHKGTDYGIGPFPWHMMENNSVEIIAAAEGIIVGRSGGNFDQSCGEDLPWNYISIEHYDGSIVDYGHMKQNSLTEKTLGDTVYVGEYLGIVGSSGWSTGPHLHFEVWENYYGGLLIDPY